MTVKTSNRRYSLLDRLLTELDHGLRVIGNAHDDAIQPSPAEHIVPPELSQAEQRQVSGLMRVNHTGEVCAQALYRGQALMARDEQTRQHLHHAAQEENDHLAWCQTRLGQLDAHSSYLNPVWYAASFTLGAVTASLGDKWSLGFVVETERQVEAHLDDHLEQLPSQDTASRAILEQMKQDEIEHAHSAQAAGAAELPEPIRFVMKLQSKLMTTTAYYV